MYPAWLNLVPVFGAAVIMVVFVVAYEVSHKIAEYNSKREHFNVTVNAH